LRAPDDNRIYVQADGEAIGNLPATISTVPDALTLLIPKRYAEL
jgi:diacylglycerol kinase family enzyme